VGYDDVYIEEMVFNHLFFFKSQTGNRTLIRRGGRNEADSNTKAGNILRQAQGDNITNPYPSTLR
jgi:hypothetical protein